MKKGFITMLVLTIFLTLSLGFGQTADAKRGGGGGIKSGKSSFTQKTDTSQKSNTGSTSSTSGTKSNKTGSTATTKSGGLFGGSSFMKGMMIGGLAGMLFGGMFANMGGFGEILGLLINIAAILAIFMVIRAAWTYVRNSKTAAAGHYQDRNRRDDENDRNQRGPF